MKPFDFQTGEVLLIDKPYRWTSFDAVNKIKFSIRHKLSTPGEAKVKIKVGHAGTLDPLATGLLIVCTGKETKNIDSYQAQEKEYTGTFRLGATTPCFDLEQEVDHTYPTAHISEAMIRQAAIDFTGVQEQIPPAFSAVKKEGKRAYKLARAGQEVVLQARTIEIKEFEITDIRMPDIDFRIVCTKGTYIRSMARDFGLALDSGAHLIALRRTRIGSFNVEKALCISDFEALV